MERQEEIFSAPFDLNESGNYETGYLVLTGEQILVLGEGKNRTGQIALKEITGIAVENGIDASYEEVVRAAKMANAHDFICRTPDGYNTYVGEGGHNLSGGERQRIAIARAILCNPAILILDEATASLDTESEYLIQQALGRLKEGRTTFAIAHRLSTLKEADRLVVIDGHRIAETGSHEQLMEKKGIYYGLVQAQLQMQNRKKDLYAEL